MAENKNHEIIIVVIVVITLAAIMCLNIGLGHYLRHAKIVDVFHESAGPAISVTDPNEGSAVVKDIYKEYSGDNLVAVYTYEHTPGWTKSSLDESSIRGILMAIDFALIGVGVFAYLIYKSIDQHNDRKTVRLFCLLSVFIVFAAIGIYCLFYEFSHTPRIYNNEYNSNENVPISFITDDQLSGSGVLQIFRIRGDMKHE